MIVAIPGPSVMFTVNRALTAGRRIALFNVIGNTLGLLTQVVAVASGLGAAVERSAEIFTAVKVPGGVYLVYLATQSIRRRRSLAEVVAAGAQVITPRRAVRDGAVVGITNPKTIAAMVATLPQFTVPGPGHLMVQLLTLGALFPLIALVLDSAWAVAAGRASMWLSRSPRRLVAVGGAGGLAVIGIGVSLGATGWKD